MKTKFLLSFICLFVIIQSSTGQSYYLLNYSYPDSQLTVSESALLILYDNGTGIARIRRSDTSLFEMPVSESFVLAADSSIDPSIIKYQGAESLIKKGSLSPRPLSLSFWFRLNPMVGAAEPWMILINSNDTARGIRFQSVEEVGPRHLSDSNFVLSYFMRDEAFYQNRFGPKSRGGKLTGRDKETRLLLLVVAQTFDKKIGPGTRIDAQNVIATFSSVAAMLQIRMIIDTVFGEKYGRNSVKKAIDKLKPTPADIVIFWYSGHGFTQTNSPNRTVNAKKYSWMDLLDPRQKPRPNPRDSAMNIEDVYTLIKSKPARLRLVVSDCCNDSIIPRKKDGIPPWVKPKAPYPPKWNWDNLYSLFIKTRGTMLFTAASVNQQAYTDTSKGSVFTNAILSSLVANLVPDAQSPDWRKIWLAARQQTMTRVKNAKIKCPLPFQPNNTCEQVPPEPPRN